MISESKLAKQPFKCGLSDRGLELQYLEIFSDDIQTPLGGSPKSDKKFKSKLIKTRSNLLNLARNCLFDYDKQSEKKNENQEDFIPCRLVQFVFLVPYISPKFLRKILSDYKSEENKRNFYEYERNFFSSKRLPEIDLLNQINFHWKKQVQLSEQYVKRLKEAPNSKEYRSYEQLMAIENMVRSDREFYKPLENTSKENTYLKWVLTSSKYALYKGCVHI